MTPDEQRTSDLRDLVWHALTQAGIKTNRAMVDVLLDGIAQSLEIFRAEEAAFVPIRVQHDALRALFTLLDEDDPSPALIRVRFSKLPAPAVAHVMRRAKVVWPSLMKAAFSREVFDHWLATAGSKDLVGSPACARDGGRHSPRRAQRRSSCQVAL